MPMTCMALVTLVHVVAPGSALQGAHNRRNYTGLFNEVKTRPDIYNAARFELQTYTWNDIDPKLVPIELRSKLVAKKFLRFPVLQQLLDTGLQANR